jgi:hypothetical protein
MPAPAPGLENSTRLVHRGRMHAPTWLENSPEDVDSCQRPIVLAEPRQRAQHEWLASASAGKEHDAIFGVT